MRDIIETIKNEVERINEDIVSNNIDCHPTTVLDDLLSFLDTLESGCSEIPNDLEEAAKAYALDTAEDSEQYSARYLGYKDGAKWQKEQDDKELSEKIAAAYQLGVKDKEQKFVDGLDEAAAQYARDYTENDEGNGGDDWEDDIRITFKAGAKWQAEQYHFFNKAWAENMQAELDRNYENGKQAMKELMMKEAVEGYVVKDITGSLAVTAKGINLDGFKFGDKVLIIVIPNTDKK